MVMFDSLNRRYLPNYGCEWTHAPNFQRLEDRTVTFDNCYVGSMPCMPARRELHTGRMNFLHRGWGPLEPFDDSMPEILKESGIYTHLTSDHQHYWEDGGATYHSRYTSWEISRGQEGDPWKGIVHDDPEMLEKIKQYPMFKDVEKLHAFFPTRMGRQDRINRETMNTEEKMSQAVTFKNGLEFIEKNHGEDEWFLQIETFDPHEPFFSSPRFKAMYPDVDFVGMDMDWPPYGPVKEDERTVEHARKNYAALLSMCDYYLGQVLDMMDRYDMWKDTMLVVNTDHGYLLGEHGWWAKSVMPVYNEIAHTPLFIWDPRTNIRGEHRQSLVQTIDLAPTMLEFFGREIPKDMEGKPLRAVIETDEPVRQYALFGYFGCQTNITDGKYVYMRAPVSKENGPLYEYTLMPTHMRSRFSPEELQDIELEEPFAFTKGCRTMKIKPKDAQITFAQLDTTLYNIEEDAGELSPITEEETEIRLANAMAELMRKNDAPAEQFVRMGLPAEGEYTAKMHREYQENRKQG